MSWKYSGLASNTFVWGASCPTLHFFWQIFIYLDSISVSTLEQACVQQLLDPGLWTGNSISGKSRVKCIFQKFFDKINFSHWFFCLSTSNFIQGVTTSDQIPTLDTRPLCRTQTGVRRVEISATRNSAVGISVTQSISHKLKIDPNLTA